MSSNRNTNSTGQYGDEQKSAFDKVGDKIKNVFGKESNNNEGGNSQYDQTSYGSAGRGNDSFESTGEYEESYDSSNINQKPYQTPGNKYETSRKEQDQVGTNEGFEPTDSGFGMYGKDGDTFGSSENDPGNPSKGGNAYDFSERRGDHDYETPRKGFGTTGGGGDSYGSGYVESE